MTNFSEAQHPRNLDGKFATKNFAESDTTLLDPPTQERWYSDSDLPPLSAEQIADAGGFTTSLSVNHHRENMFVDSFDTEDGTEDMWVDEIQIRDSNGETLDVLEVAASETSTPHDDEVFNNGWNVIGQDQAGQPVLTHPDFHTPQSAATMLVGEGYNPDSVNSLISESVKGNKWDGLHKDDVDKIRQQLTAGR